MKKLSIQQLSNPHRIATGAILGVTLALGLTPATQANNLVQNGSFESTSYFTHNAWVPVTGSSSEFGTHLPNFRVDDWTTTGFNMLYVSGQADALGANSQFGAHSTLLWGPNNPTNPSHNGLTSSPDGGNFIAGDGDFEVGAIEQTINGLVAGKTYSLEFYWGAAQQYGRYGTTTENWQVSLGAETAYTSTIHLPSEGFSGWRHQKFVFTASQSSEVLSFLAHGTPMGMPPFSLLDGVSLNANVPDGASTAVLFGASALLLGGLRLRFARR